MKALYNFLADRPWIWITIGFVTMLCGLATVVVIAEKNKPAPVPLEAPR